MSVSIEIRFKEGDEIGHHLFVRKHATRVEQNDRPSGRTVLVCNCPPWCPPDAVRRLFGRFGAIESVQTQLKPGKREEKSVETAGRFTGNGILLRDLVGLVTEEFFCRDRYLTRMFFRPK